MGIIDIVLIVIMLITIIIGYKKGFMREVLNKFGILVIIGFSIMFSGQIALLLKTSNMFTIYSSIYNSLYNGIADKISAYSPSASTQEIISEAFGMNSFFAGIVANMIGSTDSTSIIETIEFIAESITNIFMNIIGFGMIFIIGMIILLILYSIAKGLRNSKVIRIIDGILGMALSSIVTLAFIFAVFALARWLMGFDWFPEAASNWIASDLCLSDPNTFRISKAIYENNVLVNIISIFIPA